jgi:hypothetical protein
MNIFPAREYIYLNGKSPRLLMDIPNIVSLNDFPEFINPMVPWKLVDNYLYINTWIGRDSKYVLPGIGCTVEKLHEMYNDILGQINYETLTSMKPIDYLTDFNYKLFNCDLVNNFIDRNKENKKIYISNGNVQSSQAENFDMSPIIKELAKLYPDIIFFITTNFDNNESNIIDANALTPVGLVTNLVELSYLSTFCDMLIGRNSGPHVFAWTKENCFSNKVNITFSHRIECQHFVYDSPITMKKYWYSSSKPIEEMIQFIKETIEKELI